MLHFVLKDYLNIGSILTDYLNKNSFKDYLKTNIDISLFSRASP